MRRRTPRLVRVRRWTPSGRQRAARLRSPLADPQERPGRGLARLRRRLQGLPTQIEDLHHASGRAQALLHIPPDRRNLGERPRDPPDQNHERQQGTRVMFLATAARATAAETRTTNID